MSYSIDAKDAGCYPGTTVLINKLNIHEQEALDRAERVAVSLREIEIEKEQNRATFTFDFYLDLHRQSLSRSHTKPPVFFENRRFFQLFSPVYFSEKAPLTTD